MNTRGLINVIPEINRRTITTYSNLIAQATVNGNSDMATEYSKKLRGYLECMKDMGVITENGVKQLYLYYRSTRVDSNIEKGKYNASANQ